jgi:hypothetical protein
MTLRRQLQRQFRRGRTGLGLAALGAALTAAPPGAGAADAEEALATPVVSRLSAPATRGEKPRPPAWMGENVHFKKGYGFEYRRELRMGETPLELGFKGPVVRKKKRLGLTVEVRF